VSGQKDGPPLLSIVLPTFNERENILLLMDEIERVVDVPYEAIVVDDDSPDGTWRAVEEYALRHPRVRLLRRVDARGLTGALNEGIKLSRGRLIMWMDVDFSMSPERIPALLRTIDAGADVALGSRYVSGGGDVRGSGLQLTVQLVLSKLLSILCGWTLGCKVSDWSSGYIMLKREMLENYELRGDHGEYFIGLLHYLIKRRGAGVIEVPYVLTPRQWGESKTATNLWGLFRRGWWYLLMIWQVRVGRR
jgi:dolichol-phosphate mannosyltransferase